jgi:transcriptional regulator with XRE-family HTH domain
MANKTALLLPSTRQLLIDLGERLKLARLRRKLTAKQVAERAGMSPMTLRSLEAGGAGVTMGAYLSVMQVLGLEQDLTKLGAADDLGRQLQDSRLLAPHARRTAPLAVDKPAPRPGRRDDVTSRGNSTSAAQRPAAVSSGGEPSGDRGTTAADLAALLKPVTKRRGERSRK